MADSVLYQATALFLVLYCAGCVVIGLICLLRLVVMGVWAACRLIVQALLYPLRGAARWMARAAQAGARVLDIARSPRAWLNLKMKALRDALRRWASEPGEADEEPKAKADTGADGAGKEAPRPRSSYEEALELLGLTGVEPLTRDVLKERVREIMSRIHPDKGFPNQVFAQQINMAAQRVKIAKGWR